MQLDIEAIAEHGMHGSQRRLGVFGLALAKGDIDRTIGAAGQQDQAFVVGGDLIPRQMWLVHIVAVDKGNRGQRHQVLVAGLILHQHDDCRDARPFPTAAPLSMQAPRIGRAQPTIGWTPLSLQYWENSEGAEEIATVGDSDGGHGVLDGQLGDIRGLDRPFEQRIGRAHAQMDEILGLTATLASLEQAQGMTATQAIDTR